MLDLPYDVIDAMDTCALRFDGYAYEARLGLSEHEGVGAGLRSLFEPIVTTLTLYADDDMNFAAFFGLQRCFKWGGEYLTEDSDEHIAYDFLFLHLYRLDVPDDYRHAEYYARWQRKYEPRREEMAAVVRSALAARGNSGRSTGAIPLAPE